MDYQVSARKYRPGSFKDVVGQPHVVQTLMNAISTSRIAHAFLFSGMRGVGKTTVARILAKALNCEQGPTATPCDTCASCTEIARGTSVDVIEIDAASNTGVDDVREIRENIKFTPFRGGYRIYIIDEVHMLSNSAFNALLKTLEEPPAHAVFIFATTEIHKIPATILSRCQHYNFRRIPRLEIMCCLRHVAERDGMTLEDRSLAALAKASEGSMRDALSLLDQAVAFGGKAVRHSDLERLLGTVPQELIHAMMAAIIAGDGASAIRVIADLLDQGHDLRAFCGDLVEHIRNLLVAAVVPVPERLPALMDLSEDEVQQVAADARGFTAEQLMDLFRIFSQAEDALRLTAHPRFVLEVATVRASRLPNSQGSSVSSTSSTPQPEPRRGAGPVTEASNAPSTASPVNAAPGQPIAGTPNKPDPPGAKGQGGQAVAAAKGALDVGGKPLPESVKPEPAGAVQVDWERLLQRVAGAHPQVGLFLEMGRLVKVQGDEMTIGYPTTASVALDRIQKEDNLRLVAGVCAELVGRPVRLRVVELTEEHPDGLTRFQTRIAQEQEHKQALLERTRAQPLVKQTLEIFGGDVVEVRQVPPRKEVR